MPSCRTSEAGGRDPAPVAGRPDPDRVDASAAGSTAQRRVMTAVTRCRTAALGGHVEPCDQCGHTRVWYNSCRNRHCPMCQSLARVAWIDARMADLLDTPYFHVVFTVPQAIAGPLYSAAEASLRRTAAAARPSRSRASSC